MSSELEFLVLSFVEPLENGLVKIPRANAIYILTSIPSVYQSRREGHSRRAKDYGTRAAKGKSIVLFLLFTTVMAPGDSKVGRGVFITVGTTAFDNLIRALLVPEIIMRLNGLGYDEIRVQYGKGKDAYDAAFTPELKDLVKETGVSITGFEYEESNRITELIQEADLIISHAGTVPPKPQ